MGRQNKAGVCRCGHEIGYWHNPETGQCMRGRAWRDHLASIHGGCPCVRKVMKTAKGKTMPKRATEAVMVDGTAVRAALDQIIEGFKTVVDMWCGRARILAIESYRGPLDCVFAIARVDTGRDFSLTRPGYTDRVRGPASGAEP